ncbi:MAG: nickel-dependent lactate racemase [Firmicutes bacterium]|nr:nickel-dependent lactate racemase [Bacillota bacterium]
MPVITFGYGSEKLPLEIKEENLIASLMPRKEENCGDYTDILKSAMDAPIESPKLRDIAKPGQTVAIVVSDVTRPCPSYKILPFVLEELYAAGVKDEDIIIASGLGSHRKQTDEERARLVGQDIFDRIRVVDSDVEDYVAFGTSSAGTPFEVFRPVAEADIRICIGNIDYHYFAGYSGGCKAIVPGVCTRRTIEKNHKMMLLDDARVGKADGNPVRADMEEILNFLSIDFLVNVVLNEKKEIVAAVTGHPITAHREGCKVLDRVYKQQITELGDIVIASPGGLPKDLNVYQTQKALDNAQWAVKDGGIIILVGECKEGYGEHTFEEWVNEANCADDLIDRIHKEFRLGGHKAAAIAQVTKKADIYLVSSLPEEMVKKLYMTPFTDLKTAYDAAMKVKGENARVYCMTVGGTTLPCYEGE